MELHRVKLARLRASQCPQARIHDVKVSCGQCDKCSTISSAGQKRRREGFPASSVALKQQPISSPADATTSFISEPFLAFLPAPVFLAATPGLEAAFRVLLETIHGDLRLLMSEAEFYRLATSVLPPFAEAFGEPTGAITAAALFDFSGLQTAAWALPSGCFPELHMRARLGPEHALPAGAPPTMTRRPGFNGELKTAGNRHGIEQGVLYTTMDMVRVFFPATAAGPCPPQYFSLPPVGYAVIGYPHTAYLLALEWIGKLIVSPVSQPFFVGSAEHRAAVLGLACPVYSEPVVLPDGLMWHAGSCAAMDAQSVLWSTTGGVFRKRVRAGAHSAETFGEMHRVYTALSPLLDDGALPTAPLPRNVRMLYGAHEVLIEMELIAGEPCCDDEVTSAGPILDCIARAIVWLARKCIVYVDLRGSNVIRHASVISPVVASGTETAGPAGDYATAMAPSCATLVDFDDAVLTPLPVASIAEYEAVLETRATQLGTFASRYRSFPGVRAALTVAFASASVMG